MADAALYDAARRELGGALSTLRGFRATPCVTMTCARNHANAITVVMRILGQLAANAPDPVLRERWLSQYRALQPDAARIRDLVARADAQQGDSKYAGPDWLLGPLDKFSDTVLGFGNQVLEGAGGAIAAAPGLVRATPWLVFAAIVAAAIVLVLIGPQLLKRRGAR